MPDTEEKTVDIDTTGPGAVVDISEDKKPEDIVETVEPVVEEEKVEEKKEEVKEEIKEEETPTNQKKQSLHAKAGLRLASMLARTAIRFRWISL